MRTKGEVISNPGRRLALCVAPYFADRGVGDMRGPQNGTPICHPGGGGRPSLHTQPCGTQDDTHRTTAEAQPRTTSGVRLCTGAIWHAPHVATTPRGEIRGYARLPPPPGWRKCSPPVIVSAAGGDAEAAHVGNVEQGTLFALWTFHPAFLAFLAQKFHYLTFFESKSQRFSLSLWDCNILAWIFLNIHFFKTPLSAYFS